MLKFLKEIEKTGKNTDEAIQKAMAELNVTDKKDVNIEIINEGTKGFLGLGSKDAQVRLTIKDPNAALAKLFLNKLFESMKVDVFVEAFSDDEGVKVNLSGESMGIIIGKRGDTLDSIQYLTSLVVNRENNDYIKVIVDTENYREKRNEALLALAERLAQKVGKTGKKYTLEPMNPYERRIIHSTLQNNEFVTTFSVGEDPYRKVVIAPKHSSYKKSRSASYSQSYASSYESYKKTAPRHDTVKKAESFEAYQSARDGEANSENKDTEE